MIVLHTQEEVTLVRNPREQRVGRECENMPVSSWGSDCLLPRLEDLNTLLRRFIWETVGTRSLDGLFTFKQDRLVHM